MNYSNSLKDMEGDGPFPTDKINHEIGKEGEIIGNLLEYGVF